MAIRPLSGDDIKAMSGQIQPSFNTMTEQQVTFQQTVNNNIQVVINSVWACIEHAEADNQFTTQLGEAALNYIALTRVTSNFDLDGNFLVAIPAEIAAFGTGAQLLYGAPLWTPKQTALKQV